MLFNSFVFVGLFLPISVVLFWLMPTNKFKRGMLLISSLIFYAYWNPLYVLLLVGLVWAAWYCAIIAERTNSLLPVLVAATILLGSLCYFKYFNFLIQILEDLNFLSPYSQRVNIILPLGISFIVFQALGYVVDVHRKEFHAEKSFWNILLFKAFFPQLIAGPICRAHELIPQIKGYFQFNIHKFLSGTAIFSVGLLLKEFLADGISPVVNLLYLKSNLTTLDAWCASLGFGVQIYADFWGYSTMAIGLAKMFAIEIPVNFKLPYLASSLRDFWRRWHITLSEWLRDYLYKPLGGSRNGYYRTIIALLITMLLGGFWHGANYTFLIWGLIHGIALIIEHSFAFIRYRDSYLSKLLGWMYTFLVVFVAWVFFRASNLNQAYEIIFTMFSVDFSPQISQEATQVLFYFGCLVLFIVPIDNLLRLLRAEKIPGHISILVTIWLGILSLILGAPVNRPFIYFQF